MGAIRFVGNLPPWMIFIAAVAAAIGVVVYYLRETRSLPSPANFLIPSLRAAAVAVVIVTLAGPVWHRRTIVGTLARVVIAVDESDSMTSSDTSPTASDESSVSLNRRVNRVQTLLDGNRDGAGWLERLDKTHQVDVLRSSQGNRTDLGSVLSSVSTSDSNQTAVVLFSDGRNNAGTSPVDEADLLHSSGIVVHTIGVGNLDEPPGFGIVGVDRPESVAVGGSMVGEILVQHFNGATEQVNVRIETAAGKTLWNKSLKLDSGVQQSVRFDLDVDQVLKEIAGNATSGIDRSTMVMDLRAVVSADAGKSDSEDWIKQNNEFAFRVAVAIRKRQLLILDGSSRWETRYLKNLFSRDPAWTVNTVLFGVGTDSPRMLHGDDGGQYPDRQETMAKYDAVILGEIPAEFFDERDSQLLRDFVVRGGGLIVIDGQYGQLTKLTETKLSELIPVRYEESIAAPPQQIVPTGLGREQSTMDLIGDLAEAESFWKHLPAPTMINSVTPQTGAEVWAEAIDPRGLRQPWLVTRLYGGGRVFYFASDQTWRWRYKVADRYHARFWNQVMEAVMQPPYSASDEYLAVGTDRLEYESGDKAIVRARLQDAHGSPVGDSTVDALLVSTDLDSIDQLVATVPLVVDDAARGTYRGQASELPDGAYEVRIRASGFDQSALRATTPIWIGGNQNAEWNRVSVNEPLLTSIAAAGGGQYRHESSAEDMLDQLESLSTGRVIESDFSLWESYYWFWAVIGLLTGEWILRKRNGLV